jgi:hypothetical protein
VHVGDSVGVTVGKSVGELLGVAVGASVIATVLFLTVTMFPIRVIAAELASRGPVTAARPTVIVCWAMTVPTMVAAEPMDAVVPTFQKTLSTEDPAKLIISIVAAAVTVNVVPI